MVLISRHEMAEAAKAKFEEKTDEGASDNSIWGAVVGVITQKVHQNLGGDITLKRLRGEAED